MICPASILKAYQVCLLYYIVFALVKLDLNYASLLLKSITKLFHKIRSKRIYNWLFPALSQCHNLLQMTTIKNEYVKILLSLLSRTLCVHHIYYYYYFLCVWISVVIQMIHDCDLFKKTTTTSKIVVNNSFKSNTIKEYKKLKINK